MRTRPDAVRKRLSVAAAVLTIAGAVAADSYALLVGINDYEVKPLKYCTRDTMAMTELLTEKYGFPESNVRVLMDQQATCDAIVSGLEELTRTTRTGDAVVFYYSGHGVQIDDASGDEPDGLDEALVPVDCVGRVDKVILDDKLGAILSAMPDREMITIFDSCHSGTATRTAGLLTKSVSATEFKLIANSPNSARQARAARTSVPDAQRGLAGIFDIDAALVKADSGLDQFFGEESAVSSQPGSGRVLCISGCRPEEKSRDGILISGIVQPHGALTYHLLHALRESERNPAQGPLTASRLREYLSEQFPPDQGTQHPVIEADAQRMKLPVIPKATFGAIEDPAGTVEGKILQNGTCLLNLPGGVRAARQGDGLRLQLTCDTKPPPAPMHRLMVWDLLQNGDFSPEDEAFLIEPLRAGRSTWERVMKPRAGQAGEVGQAGEGLSLVTAAVYAVPPSGKTVADMAMAVSPELPAGMRGLSSRDTGVGERILKQHAALLEIARAWTPRKGPGGLTVKVQTAMEGGKVRFSFQADRKCSAIACYRNSRGGFQVLPVNPSGEGAFDLPAGRELLFPRQGSVAVEGGAGAEQLLLLALDEPPDTRGADTPALIAGCWAIAGAASDLAVVTVPNPGPAGLTSTPSGGAAQSGSFRPASASSTAAVQSGNSPADLEQYFK